MAHGDFILEVFTRLPAGTGGRRTVLALVDAVNPELRCDLIGKGEPLRTPVIPAAVEDMISNWEIGGLSPMLAKRGPRGYRLDFRWPMSPGSESGAGATGATCWVKRGIRIRDLEDLFCLLVAQMEADFAFLTTERDHRLKHFRVRRTERGIEESYEGLEIGSVLPGIYWRTYWSKRLLSSLSLNEASMEELPGSHTWLNDGLLVSLYKEKELETEKAALIEREVIQKLGHQKFFRLSEQVSTDL